MGANLATAARRSSRVPATVPLLVTSLEPGAHFSEMCETLVVSAHGCAMRSPMKLDAGVPIHFHSKEGRQTKARVVECKPMGPDQQGWMLAATLERPENFWGLKSFPKDWSQLPMLPATSETHLVRKTSTNVTAIPKGQSQASPSAKPLTKEHLRAMVAELVQPWHEELRELREKMTRGEPRRSSSFEVSLSQIPPELEHQLWIRLRQDLGTQIQLQTREQAEQVLEATQATIETKVAEAQAQFRQQVGAELRSVEARAKAISEDISSSVGQHISVAVESFQQRTVAAGNNLAQRSEDLFHTLQQHLREEHAEHHRKMQEIQTAMASESAQLQSQLVDFGNRISRLNESVRRLESDLDAHLEHLAGEIVSAAHSRLESSAEQIVKDLGTRNGEELDKQLHDACERLRIVQKGIEASVSDGLRAQKADSLLAFEQTMEELAQHSVGRWRLALAKDLNSVGKHLSEQLRPESSSNGEEN
jgi:hypothetical protein